VIIFEVPSKSALLSSGALLELVLLIEMSRSSESRSLSYAGLSSGELEKRDVMAAGRDMERLALTTRSASIAFPDPLDAVFRREAERLTSAFLGRMLESLFSETDSESRLGDLKRSRCRSMNSSVSKEDSVDFELLRRD